jgi:SAM-dependent methyltransferase
MSQITSGLRALLSQPFLYNLFQKAVGAEKVRSELVSEFILPKKNDKILDIGCGTAEILNFLPASIKYYGFDISEDYIKSAINKFGKRGNFYCANLNEPRFKNLKSFDTIIAIGVLHHLSNKEARELMILLRQKLKPGGRFISIDACLIPNQNPLAKFIIMRDRGQNIRTPKCYQGLTNKIFSKVNVALKHRHLIPYTHWIMECIK